MYSNYSQISITRSCGDYFYKYELPEVQINLHVQYVSIETNLITYYQSL